MNLGEPFIWRGRTWLLLIGLFVLALSPRLYSALNLGWNWDFPGSFTLINFDEAGSCRAALDGFDYSGFIGKQTIAIADLLGVGPSADISGNSTLVKAYCHSPEHIVIARVVSAVVGALTVVVLGVIALMLIPSRPAVAWTAGLLLALSGFHISYSQSATVDASSTFFIYLFLAFMIAAVHRQSRGMLFCSPLLLAPAIWTKYWVFALGAYAAIVPLQMWRYATSGMTRGRVALVILATAMLFALLGNSGFRDGGYYPLLALYYLLIPWGRIRRPMIAFWLSVPVLAYLLCEIPVVSSYTMGGMEGGFGAGYGAISWNKWLRNLLNLPLAVMLGLGLPALLFIPAGLRAIGRESGKERAWLCFTPWLLFFLFMALVAPVTYYRHYLPLIPLAALLAAIGLVTSRWYTRRWFLVLFFLWPGLLAVDMVRDYHQDPRRELLPWYEEHPGARVFMSYYVSPPKRLAGNSRLFRPEYAFGDAALLKQADFLILSENWYDTAFANELNGPVVSIPERLVKTKPEYAAFYRAALAGRHPHLKLERAIEVRNFMPELLFHRWFYGTFQLFVGDIMIFRVVK